MLKKIQLHPILFCLYPIIFLYSESIVEVRITDILLPLGINFGIMTILFLVIFLFTRNYNQASVQTSLILVLYSNLGRIIFLLKDRGYFAFDHRPIIIFALILLIVLTWINFRIIKNYHSITEFLNIMSLMLVIFPMFNIVRNYIQTDDFTPQPTINITQKPTELPDIYYIIVDTYAGNEMLSTVYNFDNSTFLNSLEEKGFYVAQSSHSNYMHTWQTLGSSLNLDYFPIEGEKTENNFLGYKVSSNNPYGPVSDNFVKNQLETLGYQIYVIPNYFLATSWNSGKIVGKIPLGTPFFFEYMHSSALLFFSYSLPYKIYREHILNSFNLMKESISLESPKFVFFHVSIPHPPFVFDKVGNPNYSNVPFAFSPGLYYSMPIDTYHQKYIEQLQFTNSKINDLLTQIISQIDKKSIIVLQGDHGPASYMDFNTFENNQCLYERFSILSAYFLPGYNYSNLYPEISPVNTFRLIFQHYFNLPYDLLEDHSYYSSDNNLSHYIDVTELVNSQNCNP